MHPDMFSTMVIPDFALWIARIHDGIQQCATYNPPGPTPPGFGTADHNLVGFISSFDNILHNCVNESKNMNSLDDTNLVYH